MHARRGQRFIIPIPWPNTAELRDAAIDAHIIRLMRQGAGCSNNGITAEGIDAAFDNSENDIIILIRRGDVTVAVLVASANPAPIGGSEVETFLRFIIAMPGYGRMLMRALVNFAVTLGPGRNTPMTVTIRTSATPGAEPFFRRLGFVRKQLICFGSVPMVLRLDFP